MSNEELVQQIQAGNQELMPELWGAVKGFVMQQAHKAACKLDALNEKMGLDTYNDFVNTGYLATYEAAHKYDPQRGTVFLTVLGYYIKKHFNCLYAELSGWSRSTFKKVQNTGLINVDSLNRPKYGENSEDAIELGDSIADPDDQLENLIDKLFIQSLRTELDGLLDRIDTRSAAAIRLTYYCNKTKDQVAYSLNTTASEAARLLAKGMRELRKIAVKEKSLDAYIDEHTDYYRRVGVKAFQNTGTSAVELICIRREELRQRRAHCHG